MDEPNILATSMQSVIDEVDSCLERIMVRRSSSNDTSRSSYTSSLSAANTLGDIFERNVSDLAASDGDSDSTIVLDHNYTTAQSPISNVDGTPRRTRRAAAVTESDSQSIILPEVLPRPRLLPADDVIDLSNSLVSHAPNPPATENLDVIEVSSDEDSASTGRTRTSTRFAFAHSILHELDLLDEMTDAIGLQPLRCRRHQQNSTRNHGTSRPPRSSRPRRAGISIPTDTLGSAHTSAMSTNANPSGSILPPADTTSNGTEPNASVVCPICYESLFNRKLLSTVCGHMFCEPCLRTALKISKKCPICKRAITNASHTHPIYLPVH